MAKRIFHLISELDIGGTERSLLKLLPHLQADFDNVVVCAIGRGVVGQELEQAGIRVKYLDGRPWRLYRLLRQERPDVLVTYLIYAGVFGRIIGRLEGVEKIISCQRSSLLDRPYLRWADWLTSWLVDQYVVQRSTMPVPRRPVTVIPNLVELPDLSQKQASSTLTVTCVSNLRPGKGHVYLLRAWEKISIHFPGAQLQLVGDGPLWECLAKLPNIQWLGRQDDVNDALRRSDIFVLPSLAEGMSNALLEAMSWELPCIASDIPANHAVITLEETGLLVPAADSDALAKGLERLLTNADLRQKLGAAARQYVEQHHAPRVIVPLWRVLLS